MGSQQSTSTPHPRPPIVAAPRAEIVRRLFKSIIHALILLCAEYRLRRRIRFKGCRSAIIALEHRLCLRPFGHGRTLCDGPSVCDTRRLQHRAAV